METAITPSESENVAEAMVPYFPDDHKKSKYLSYKVMGFTFKEAMHLANTTVRSIQHWRQTDEKFKQLDSMGVSEIKKNFSGEYINLYFTRNMRLVLQKDYDVLSKSVKKPDDLTDKEHQYLLKLRAFYTPQQLALIQQAVGEASTQENFTDIVFRISREREELTIAKST